MRKYHMSGVEHVHMMRHVPRSYDMTRTHIMHQGVNKHVDVVLRCSPKHWKKKKVAVSVVKSEKKNEVVRIRAHASKGYVAVRKVTNEKYEADRRKVVTAYETTYGKPSVGSRALIRDMKSQLATMAQKSADYIDRQLASAPKQPVTNRPVASPQQTVQPVQTDAPLPAFPQVPDTSSQSAAALTPEVEEILKKGGYKRPRQFSETNPYASDYLKQASDQEFRSLMTSLEKSLDEAVSKYAVEPPAEEPVAVEPPPEQQAYAVDYDDDYRQEAQSDYGEPANVGWYGEDNQETEAQPAEVPEDWDAFAPALDFSTGGQHYIPDDDLFSREFDTPDDMSEPSETGEDGEQFDVSRFFADEEFDEPSADFAYDEQDFVLPDNFTAESEEVVLPQGYTDYSQEEGAPLPSYLYADEEDGGGVPPDFSDGGDAAEFAQPTVEEDDGAGYEPLPQYPEEEVEFAAPEAWSDGQNTVANQDDGAEQPMGFPEEEEDMAPPMIFPDEDEEEWKPPMIFPDETEDSVSAPSYPGDDGGYSPAPVSPDRHEDWGDGDYATRIETGDARPTETFFTRTGGQIRKAIGVIRGKSDDVTAKKQDIGSQNGDVEITYSDRK